MAVPPKRLTAYVPFTEKSQSEDGLSTDVSIWEDHSLEEFRPIRGSQRLWKRTSTWIIIASLSLNIILALSTSHYYRLERRVNPYVWWTPFSDKLKFTNQVFASGFGAEKTKYQAPASAQKDADWRALYVEAFTVPKSSAARQINKTAPVSASPDSEYITSFNVMHYLHCLNMVRQMADMFYYPGHYNLSASHNPFVKPLAEVSGFEEGGMFAEEHMGHCIDAVRQGLMCQPDLSPVTWQWNPLVNKTQVWAQTAHSCANWDEIYQFADERRYDEEFEQHQALEEVGLCGYYDEEPCGW